MLAGNGGGASGKGVERSKRVHDRILQTWPCSGFQERLRLRCFVCFVSFCESIHPSGTGSGNQQKQTKETKKAQLRPPLSYPLCDNRPTMKRVINGLKAPAQRARIGRFGAVRSDRQIAPPGSAVSSRIFPLDFSARQRLIRICKWLKINNRSGVEASILDIGERCAAGRCAALLLLGAVQPVLQLLASPDECGRNLLHRRGRRATRRPPPVRASGQHSSAVEQRFCKPSVAGSIPAAGSSLRDMFLLALETSCDETSAAVVRDGAVLANVVSSQIQLHAEYGGVVPELATREHLRNLLPVAHAALREAGVTPPQLDAFATTRGPGLPNALMTGFKAAQAMAFASRRPFLGIHHHEAHLYSPWTVGDPPRADFASLEPNVSLIVSGGHTMLVHVRGEFHHVVLGSTLDDAAGECFDKTAKLLGLPYPGGPQMDNLAATGNPHAFDFPRPLLREANDDFSF